MVDAVIFGVNCVQNIKYMGDGAANVSAFEEVATNQIKSSTRSSGSDFGTTYGSPHP